MELTAHKNVTTHAGPCEGPPEIKGPLPIHMRGLERQPRGKEGAFNQGNNQPGNRGSRPIILFLTFFRIRFPIMARLAERLPIIHIPEKFLAAFMRYDVINHTG